MNSLFSSSWVKNVKPDTETAWNHEFKEIVNEGTRGRAAAPHYAKLMGMQSVKDLKGTMTPRYFATKVLRQLQKEHPGEKIEDIIATVTDDDIQKLMNVAAASIKNLQNRPDIKFSTGVATAKPSAEERFVRGLNASDTLKRNISAETPFEYQKDVGENSVYTAMHNGLRFRVTVKNGTGKPMSLKDIENAQILSLQVEDPSGTTTVEGPEEKGSFKRNKLAADYPHEKGEDWNEPDVEETGGKNVKREEDSEEDDTQIVNQPMYSNAEGSPNLTQPPISYEVPGAANSNIGVPMSGMTQTGEEDESLNMGDKQANLSMQKDHEFEDNEEDCKEPVNMVVVKLSPQAQQREMMNKLMQKRREMVRHQRNQDLGY